MGCSGKATAYLQGDRKFVALGMLGSGAFGDVILAKCRTSQEKVAIKFIQRGSGTITKHVLREVLTHSLLYHPGIAQFKEVFLTNTHLGLVLEYVPGCDLYEYVSTHGYIAENDARQYLQQVVVAVEYMHKMNVVNRDIKLENLLLLPDKKRLKLIDFGLAKGPEDSLPHSDVGTPHYAAPEVTQPQAGPYEGSKADVWSLGVLLFVMLFHAYPFDRPEDDPDMPAHMKFKLILKRVMKAELKIPAKPPISAECKDFIRRCLTVNPKKRISVTEIFEDVWFSKHFNMNEALKLNQRCFDKKPTAEHSKKFQENVRYIVTLARNLPTRPAEDPSKWQLEDRLGKEISDELMAEIMAGA